MPAPAPRRGLRRLPLFDRSYAQVAQYAEDWERSGARAREQTGPLWLVLGDSAAQGVGASAHDAGYVGQVLPLLGNDALGTRLPQWLADADDLTAALPPGAVVATVARGVFERKVRRYNDHLRRAAAARGLRVADLWAHTGPPYRGLYADGFHPNDAGYAQWAAALAQALELS